VLAVLFDGRGLPEQRVVILLVEEEHVGDAEAALGEGASLIEHDGVEVAGPLERRAVANQEAALGAEAGAHRHDERDGKAEGVRAGDHHDGDCPFQAEDERLPECPIPRNERDGPGRKGDQGKPVGGAVGQVLRATLRRLRLPDEIDDLIQIARLACFFHLHDERPSAVHRPTDDFVPLGLLRGHAFAGEHALVDARLPVDYRAVRRDLLAGLDLHLVPRRQVGNGHLLGVAALRDAVRRVRHEPRELFERPARPHHGSHLDPMPHQHEVDERRRLPEKHLPRHAEDDGGAVEIGDTDGEGHERHHAGRSLAQFVDHPGEEGPPAVAVDEGRQSEQDPLVPGEGPGLRHAQPPWIMGLRARMGTVATRLTTKRRRKSSTIAL